MQTISIGDVVITSGRQRRDFDEGALQALGSDIAYSDHGLLHPIILREGDEGQLILVAGERRLRAIRDLHELGIPFYHQQELVPQGEIPFIRLGRLSELSAEEAEFAENEVREQLSWQERAAANARLKDLRDRQAAAANKPAPTTREFAAEVRPSGEGVNFDQTRKELLVAKYLDDPEVQAAKGVQEAFKVLQRKERAAKHAELAEQVGMSHVGQHTCLNLDSLEWIVQAPSGHFDVILTDPPYGMGADEFGDSGGAAAAHGYSDDENTFHIALRVLEETYRIAKPEAHLYAFCDIDRFHLLRQELSRTGWKVFRTPLIWHKPAAFRAPWPEHGPQRKYELILYAIKGDRRALKLAPDVITCPPDENLGHAAQKPVALLQELLSRSVRPGDRVVDPFCGSGGIFPAASNLQVIATGIEIDKTSFGISLERLNALKGASQ